jgi:peptidoglycan hydrolase-like protein with peptidoglycan-binding domain
VGPITWGALGGDAPQPPTLRQGSTGALVATLQNVLNEGRGDFSPDIAPALLVDGVFGPKTAAEVEGTQKLAGAVIDGIVGFQTWAIPVHAMGQVIADVCGVTGPGSA